MQKRRFSLSLKSGYTTGILCLFCNACTKLPPADDCHVAYIVDNKINKEICWHQGCNQQAHDMVLCMLQQDLVVDSAVQIALFNNPQMQAIFEEVGIAQADLLQAGLFQNPIFEAYIRFPDRHALQLNSAFSVTQSFLDILLIPLREKIALTELDQAHVRVANAALGLAFDVQETFYNLQAEQAKQDLQATLVLATEATHQLALAQRQQANISELELQSRANEYLEANVKLAQGRHELIRLRERMHKLLGLSSSEICWQINNDLPELPDEEIPAECLESVAISQRLDLANARLEVKRIACMLGLKQWWAYTNATAGLSTEHEAEGFQETGVALAGAIPIFDHGQADRARLFAMYRQGEQRQKALEISILSEVRAARDQLLVNRHLVSIYLEELLPLQEQVLSTSYSYYNTMTLSVYKLLDMKKQALQMQINYKSNLRDYWLSRVALDRALGGNLNLAVENYRKTVGCENLKENE